MQDDSDLEALWQVVKPLTKTELRSRRAKFEAAEDASRAIYTNPANWQRVRGIALIHAETQTCLGNFAEYIHLRVENCRKLIREEAPLDVDGVEYVSGTWWLPREIKPQQRQVWHDTRELNLHVYLPQLVAHSPDTELVVYFAYHQLARVELAEDTTFAQWYDGGATQQFLLDLPAGTNIVEILSPACKARIMQLVSEEEESEDDTSEIPAV